MINFGNVKQFFIPEGEVVELRDAYGVSLWKRLPDELKDYVFKDGAFGDLVKQEFSLTSPIIQFNSNNYSAWHSTWKMAYEENNDFTNNYIFFTGTQNISFEITEDTLHSNFINQSGYSQLDGRIVIPLNSIIVAPNQKLTYSFDLYREMRNNRVLGNCGVSLYGTRNDSTTIETLSSIQDNYNPYAVDKWFSVKGYFQSSKNDKVNIKYIILYVGVGMTKFNNIKITVENI